MKISPARGLHSSPYKFKMRAAEVGCRKYIRDISLIAAILSSMQRTYPSGFFPSSVERFPKILARAQKCLERNMLLVRQGTPVHAVLGRYLTTLVLQLGMAQLSTVLCITVRGSRNGPPPTTNSPPKSEASSANNILARTNRFFDFWTLLALYINK